MAAPLLSTSSASGCTRVQEFGKVSSLPVLHGRTQKCILLPFAESEPLCHQLRTVFLNMKIKFTQEIFLNRAQWLNWQCYKYYRTRVYFCLYFSMPDAVKPTVNTQTFLLVVVVKESMKLL